MNNNLNNDALSAALQKAKTQIDNSVSRMSQQRAQTQFAPVEMLSILKQIQEDMKKSEEHARKFEKWSIIGIVASVIAAIFTVINFFI